MAKAERKVTVSNPRLVEALPSNGRSIKEAAETLNEVLTAITATLAKSNDLNIIVFGKFKIGHINAYDDHNPANS